MDEVFGTARWPPFAGMLLVALALAPSTTRAVEPLPSDSPPSEAPQVPEPTEDLSATEAVIAALHREGEQRYAVDDYAGARKAWLDAYERVPAGPETDPYRVTLLSLITNATVADYAVTGVQQPVQHTEQLLVSALGPQSDPELRALVEQQLDRVRPLLEAKQSVQPEPEPPRGPVLPEPDPSPPEDDPRPALHPASTPLLAVGAATVAGGLAMLGAGLAFGPRAEQQVPAGDDSDEGQAFIAQERRKGYAWIGAGAGTAVVGVALIVSGAVLRARSRRTRVRADVLLPAGGGAGLALSGRF